MSDNIWTGEKVHLRAWEPDDWKFQVRWSRDTEGDRRTFHIPFPGSQAWTRKDAEEQALRRPENDAFHWLIETLEQEPVGGINSADCDVRNGTFSFGIYVAPEYRRKGYASDAVLLLCRYMFLERRYQKGGTGAYSFNEPSQKLLQDLGFRLEGQQRRMQFSNGAYHDMLHYGITVEEFCETHAGWLAANKPSEAP
jgi:RimJ/RimL family protein N-acetyltransferase